MDYKVILKTYIPDIKKVVFFLLTLEWLGFT